MKKFCFCFPDRPGLASGPLEANDECAFYNEEQICTKSRSKWKACTFDMTYICKLSAINKLRSWKFLLKFSVPSGKSLLIIASSLRAQTTSSEILKCSNVLLMRFLIFGVMFLDVHVCHTENHHLPKCKSVVLFFLAYADHRKIVALLRLLLFPFLFANSISSAWETDYSYGYPIFISLFEYTCKWIMILLSRRK